MQFRVFISYSTNDLGHVDSLQKHLNATPIELFVAEHSVVPGENLEDKITKAIKACDLFVVLWSENAESSKWVSQEIGHAKAFDKKILPLVLSEGLTLPGFISNLKYLPSYENPQASLEKARSIIVSIYQEKQKAIAATQALASKKNQKEQEQLFLLGAGAFLLWAFSK